MGTDTTTKIWEYYFKARIPYLQSRSLQQLEKLGTVVTGIPEIDKDIENQYITTMLTIAQMVELYQEGVPIKVVNRNDIKEIYQYISEHIHAWKQVLERGINIGDAPIEDLIAMDQFANVVYEHAVYQFTREIADSILIRHLSDTQRISSSNFFNSTVTTKLVGHKPGEDGIIRINSDETLPERDSLSNFFKDKLITLRR